MKRFQISDLKFEIVMGAALFLFALPAQASPQYGPSNLLKEGEGLVGVQGDWLREKLSVTGDVGTGSARVRYPVEAMVVSGVGGYGFTDSLDGFLRFGGTFSPSVSGAADRRATGLAGGLGLRYSLVGSRSVELGVFSEATFVSEVSNDAHLTMGNVRLPGMVRLKNMAALTLGMGPQWWWQVGAQKYIFPSLSVFISPRFVGSATFRQKVAAGENAATDQKLQDVDAVARQLFGFGGGVGFDLRRAILRVGVQWFGTLGGGGSLEVPF